MNQKGTVILEGGANRGVFTSGVLDYLMDEAFFFSNIIGVSAGACNGVSYASHQRGRSKKCYIITDKKNKWIKKENLLRGKSLLDMEKLFVTFPQETFPFDYESFYRYKINIDIVATNCETGESEYFQMQHLKPSMIYCQASCSMPLISNEVEIEGKYYLDGSISNSVPLDRAYEIGNKKNVIILTKEKGYRKKALAHWTKQFIKIRYKKYPQIIKALLNRPNEYNSQMDRIEQLEKAGDIFVIRPSIESISRTETDIAKLENLYNHGYSTMQKEFKALINYIDK